MKKVLYPQGLGYREESVIKYFLISQSIHVGTQKNSLNEAVI